MASMPSRAAAADAVTSRAADASTFEAEISPLLGAARRRHRRFASGGWSQAGGGEGLTFADVLHGWTFNGATVGDDRRRDHPAAPAHHRTGFRIRFLAPPSNRRSGGEVAPVVGHEG